VGPSIGRIDVGAEQLVASPIRGRTYELKVIGASVTAVARAGRPLFEDAGANFSRHSPAKVDTTKPTVGRCC